MMEPEKKTKSLLLIALLLTAGTWTAQAQQVYSSPYSVYGLGMINRRTATLNRSIGGTGIGVQDDYSLNPANPASYASIVSPVSHIYEMGLYIESNRYQTKNLTESKGTGSITNLNYWFKFSKWWAATAGLTPYSNVGYKISTNRQLGAAINVDYTYEGSGNINQLYLGNGFNITPNLSAGFHLAYLFGNITKTETIAPNGESSALTYSNQVVARKLDLDFGLQYKINFKKRSLIIGVVADDGMTLHGKQEGALYDAAADTLDSGKGDRLTYTLPASIGGGLSLRSKRSTLATDLIFENWSQAKYDQQDLVFQDTWRFSAGYIYHGNPNAESYLGLASLRAGFYVQDYALKLSGRTLPAWGMSGGISLPVFDGRSAVNLTYNYDKFGTTDRSLVLQRSQKFMIDLVIRDMWGIKRKFD
ncbi:hypothetical protein [Parachryseolinea silvisoli]|jgi:hypothetical protein|uniref:hypothetical protein n=1 Tax=Parachryseolinea silvisoli TaxID=2873601 RepID=UPI00226597D5|nr:hypothetical protein [Parachryseolinea silvisoli]MCD9015850.1 hypothetical protein [Parachryseolinea silvisoli]